MLGEDGASVGRQGRKKQRICGLSSGSPATIVFGYSFDAANNRRSSTGDYRQTHDRRAEDEKGLYSLTKVHSVPAEVPAISGKRKAVHEPKSWTASGELLGLACGLTGCCSRRRSTKQ